jgi:hypothetical protein
LLFCFKDSPAYMLPTFLHLDLRIIFNKQLQGIEFQYCKVTSGSLTCHYRRRESDTASCTIPFLKRCIPGWKPLRLPAHRDARRSSPCRNRITGGTDATGTAEEGSGGKTKRGWNVIRTSNDNANNPVPLTPTGRFSIKSYWNG